jgi:hypothetical protein
VSLEAHDGNALDALHARLRERGIPIVSTEPAETGLGQAIRFKAPSALGQAIRFKAPAGHVIEVFAGDGERWDLAHGRGCAAAEVRPSDAHL